MSKKYYLAGPMQGIPQFNFPLFYRAAAVLREYGLDIISPAEIDDKEDNGAAMKSKTGNLATDSVKTWGDFLSRDVKLLADGGITGIVFLPGWENSKGAKLEATVGLLLKFEFLRWDAEAECAFPYSRTSVACELHRSFMEIK